jgi:predicted nucleic acid-binding Zn ribbon protein
MLGTGFCYSASYLLVMARKSHPIGIQQALQGMLDAQGLSHLVAEQALHKGWVALFGVKAAPLCELISLRDGILRVRVKDAVWRQELHFQRHQIMTKANGLLGSNAVKDFVVT